MKRKLTPKQQEVLDALRKPGAKAHYMPYMGRFGGAYWFLSSTHQECTKQIDKLVSLGLVKKTKTHRNNEIALAVPESELPK